MKKNFLTLLALSAMLPTFSMGIEIIGTPKAVAEISHGFRGSDTIKTFCRNNIQWIIVSEFNKVGIAMDAEPVDVNDLSKGIKAIACKK